MVNTGEGVGYITHQADKKNQFMTTWHDCTLEKRHRRIISYANYQSTCKRTSKVPLDLLDDAHNTFIKEGDTEGEHEM